MKFKFPSIKEQGGILVKLDNEKEKHRGFGSRELLIFKERYDAGKMPLTVAADLMNVGSTKTIKNWFDRVDEEKAST